MHSSPPHAKTGILRNVVGWQNAQNIRVVKRVRTGVTWSIFTNAVDILRLIMDGRVEDGRQ